MPIQKGFGGKSPTLPPAGPPPSAATSVHVRSIAVDIVLTLLTCGLFNVYVQYTQMQALNDILREKKYSFWPFILLTLVTCGLYMIYHEYRKSHDLEIAMKREGSGEPVIVIVLTLIGLHLVADAIQQSHINRYYGHTGL